MENVKSKKWFNGKEVLDQGSSLATYVSPENF